MQADDLKQDQQAMGTNFDPPVQYRSARSMTLGLVLNVGGGMLAIGLGVIGFLVALQSDVTQFQLHLMSTLPVIVGVFSLMRGYSLMSACTGVVLSEQGVTIETRGRGRTIAWPQIADARIEDAAMGAGKQLGLYDPRGKKIAVISGDLEQFAELAEQVQARAAMRNDDAADQVAATLSRKAMLFAALGAVMTLVMGVGMLLLTQSEQREVELLQTQAAAGEGRVVELFIAPDGRTRRVVYEVTGEGGQVGERNAEVEAPYWDTLTVGQMLAVTYVPSDPHISRLVEGEVLPDEPMDSPLVGYGVAAVLLLFSLACAGLTVAGLLGYDLSAIA